MPPRVPLEFGGVLFRDVPAAATVTIFRAANLLPAAGAAPAPGANGVFLEPDPLVPAVGPKTAGIWRGVDIPTTQLLESEQRLIRAKLLGFGIALRVALADTPSSRLVAWKLIEVETNEAGEEKAGGTFLERVISDALQPRVVGGANAFRSPIETRENTPVELRVVQPVNPADTILRRNGQLKVSVWNTPGSTVAAGKLIEAIAAVAHWAPHDEVDEENP